MKTRLLLIVTALLIFGWETAQAQFTGGIGRGDSMGQLTIIGDPEPPDSDTRLRLQIMQLGNNVDLSKVRIHWSVSGPDPFVTEYLDVDIANNTSIVDIHRNNFIDPVLGLTANGVYIKHIEILNVNEQIIGRMSTNISLNNKASSNDRSDLLIYLHHDIETGWHSGTDWEYFSSEYEVPTTMLVPPGGRLDNIDTSMDPLLFVHGLSGSYPYWNEEISESDWQQLDDAGFDSWQFYYPYDMSIPEIGTMLGRALEVMTISSTSDFNAGYNVSKIPIAAHSMGGLVTRSYIQNNENNRVERLLMLATPNNGSLGSWYLLNDLRNIPIGIFKDINSPAVKQLSVGSGFLVDLNELPPNMLGNSLEDDYLVMAGTNNSGWDSWIFKEIKNQHDNVVALSSASLTNYDIPLYAYEKNHGEMKNPGIENIINFFNNEYDYNGWVAYWNNSNDLSFDAIQSDKGIVMLDLPNTNRYIPFIFKDEVENELRFFMNYHPIFMSGAFILDRFTHARNGLHFLGSNFDRTPPQDMGFNLNPDIDTISFGRYDKCPLCLTREWKPIKTFLMNEEYTVEPFQTNKWSFPLTGADVMVLMDESESGQANILSQNLSNEPDQSQTSWFIDAAIDSVAFYMSVAQEMSESDTYNISLQTPSGNTLTPTDAEMSNDLIFVEDTTNGFAYYFVRDPEPGVWGLNHNQPVEDVFVSAPIGTDVDFKINRPLLDIYVGKSFDIEFLTSVDDDYSIELTSSVFYNQDGESEIFLEELDIIENVELGYFTSSFVPQSIGTYRFEVKMQVIGQELNIVREQQFEIDAAVLSTLETPELLTPEEGSTDITNYVNLEWLPVDEAEAYSVQVYRINESESPDDKINDLSDSELIIEGTVEETELALENLQLGSDYIWRIKAIGEDAASAWSEGSGFSNASNEYTLLKSNGWQLVGLPLEVFNNSVGNIYPNALSNTLFNYDGTYSPVQELHMGKGYWIRYGEPESESVVGEYLGFVEIELNPGWNLISPASFSISPESIVDFDGIIDNDLIFGFEGSYFKPDILYPGTGYWLYANDGGIITIDDSSEQPEILIKRDKYHTQPDGFNTINITTNEIKLPNLYFDGEIEDDALIKYLLPPKPPSGIADARLSNGKTLTTDSEAIIEIQQSVDNPIILSIEAVESGQIFNVSEFHGNHLISEQEVIDGDELQLNENTKRLLVTIKQDADMDELPKEYALAQNYPNPFNPVTNLEYSLPEDVNVRLDIYNILGQRVATLHDGPQVAGRYIINFDASHLASGLYIYRLQAGDFIESRKMLLVK